MDLVCDVYVPPQINIMPEKSGLRLKNMNILTCQIKNTQKFKIMISYNCICNINIYTNKLSII